MTKTIVSSRTHLTVKKRSKNGKERNPSNSIVGLINLNVSATWTLGGLASRTVSNNVSSLRPKKTSRIAKAVFTRPMIAIMQEVDMQMRVVATHVVSHSAERRELEASNLKIIPTSKSNVLGKILQR